MTTDFKFSTPANVQDFGDDPTQQARLDNYWNLALTAYTRAANVSNPWTVDYQAPCDWYIDPTTTEVKWDGAPVEPVFWTAFPNRLKLYFSSAEHSPYNLDIMQVYALADYGNLPASGQFATGLPFIIPAQRCPYLDWDQAINQWQSYDPNGPRGWLDEYCEWAVTRNSEGKITKISFTCENPEYWYTLWQVSPNRVLDLYQQLVNPKVTLADLQLHSDGNLVYYEILMGEDEYNFIVDNGLYNADNQASFLKAKNNIALPMGQGDSLGGLELKAAWLAVPNPADPKWTRYKTMQALVYDESTDSCSAKTLALVGLHIIHKTASQPQWVWATFEHVDNAPDTTAIDENGSVSGDFTFYNNSCSEQPVPAGCKAKLVNGTPVTKTSCAPNVSPAYYLDGTDNCPANPVRVSRIFAIKDTTDNHVLSLNRAVQQLITQANPDSVYANYLLVNVLWSSAAVNDNDPPGNPPVTPLSTSGETPSLNTVPVANTTLETYAQGFNCLSCHAYASVPSAVAEQLGGTTFATDYSFIFGMASSAATTDKH